MAAKTSRCTRCGRQLPREDSGGNCPWCLFAATLGQTSPAPETNSPPEALFESLASFDDLEEVGRGGSSVVYRARQTSVQRIVALKMLHGSAGAPHEAYQRLQIEAEAVARLDHPNIVPLYGVGRDLGTPFLVLKFFPHGNLAEALKRRPYSTREAARLMATVARAVHHAHQRGVIHRDLKPSNIMLDAEGNPHVADFGLARLADQENPLTLAPLVMGTPSYMAPEQTLGDRKAVGTPADVYALGAILYELLTRRPPFLGDTAVGILKQVVEDEPPTPRSQVPELSRDLEAICLHCLEKAPHRRYPSALDLALDLERWLNHETITVRPGGTSTQFLRWVRRRPGVAALTGTVALSLAIGLATTTWQWRRATTSRTHATRLLYAANMNLAQADWQAGNLTRLRTLLRETASSPERGFEWYYWQRRAHQELRAIQAHAGPVNDIDFSPDGQQLVTAGEDGVAKTWNVATGSLILSLPHGKPVHSAEYSRDGRRILTADDASVVRLWDAAAGIPELVFQTGTKHPIALLSPDGTRIVTVDWDSWVQAWDARDGRRLFQSRVPWGRIKCAAFLPDGHSVLTGGEDDTVRQWDAETGTELRVLRNHSEDVNSIDITPDGSRFATAGYDRTIRLWSLPEGIEQRSLTEPDLFATWVAWAPDGSRVASCSMYNTYVPRIWNLDANVQTPPERLPAHETAILRIQFSPDGTHIATASSDGTVRIWDANTAPGRFGRPTGRSPIVVSPGNHRLIIAEPGAPATEYDTRTAKPVADWTGIAPPIAISRDESRIAAVRDNAVLVMNATNRAVLNTLVPHSTPVEMLAFSPDDSQLAVAGPRGVEVWELNSGIRRHHWPDARTPVQFGSLPYQLVTGWTNGGLLWDSRTGEIRSRWPGREAMKVAFSSDGRHIATAVDDAVTLRDGDGNPLRTIPNEPSQDYIPLFSPDGTHLALGCWWGSPEIRIFEVSTGAIVHVLRGHTGFIESLEYSKDGRRLLSASKDGSARLWETTGGREVLVLRPDGRLAECISAQFVDAETGILLLFRDGTAQRWDAATPGQIAAWTRGL